MLAGTWPCMRNIYRKYLSNINGGHNLCHTYEIAGANVQRRRGQDLTHDRRNAASNNMEAALVRPAAVPRVCNGEQAGKDIGRRGEEEGLDLREAKGLHDSWEEVCGAPG